MSNTEDKKRDEALKDLEDALVVYRDALRPPDPALIQEEIELLLREPGYVQELERIHTKYMGGPLGVVKKMEAVKSASKEEAGVILNDLLVSIGRAQAIILGEEDHG